MLGVQGALPHCEMKTYGILYCIFSCVPFVYLKKKENPFVVTIYFYFCFFSLSSSSKPIVSIVQSFEYFRTLYERLQ